MKIDRTLERSGHISKQYTRNTDPSSDRQKHNIIGRLRTILAVYKLWL